MTRGYARSVVHRLIAAGWTVAAIAAELGVTRAAVDYHLRELHLRGLIVPGPWRSVVDPDAAPAVERRTAVVRTLTLAEEPLTLAEVSRRAGLPPTAGRHRLYALLADGAVRRSGRGPATAWTLRRAA